jgi:hypothetical protein
VIAFAAGLLVAGCGKQSSVPDPNVCRSNLRLINNAKHHWALEHRVSARATPTEEALSPYIQGGFDALRCPDGGEYSINPMHSVPTCSVEGHKLPLDPGAGMAPVKDALESP